MVGRGVDLQELDLVTDGDVGRGHEIATRNRATDGFHS